MRKSSPQLLPLLVLLWLAAPVAAQDDGFSGRYEGRIGDAPATLTLRVSDSVVSGRIARPDAVDVELNGTSADGRVVGVAITKRGAGFFEAYREFGALVMVIRESGTVTGQPLAVRVEFFPAVQSPKPDNADRTSAERDQNLVGIWTTRGLERRGDMVLPVTTVMVLGADGGYSASSEPPEESKKGEWRSQRGTLEYRPQNAEAWSALGEYRLHGDNLITILPEQVPRVWTRHSDS